MKRRPRTRGPGPARHPEGPLDRQTLLAELLEELTSHSPTAMMRYMRRWPSGPLSLVHLHVLTVLDAEGPVPMRALAESLDVSQASATGIVDRMEQRGIVERHRDETDRRVIRVCLAEPGRLLIEGVAADRRAHLARILDELTDEELSGFLNGTRALQRARERLHSTPAGAPAAVATTVATTASAATRAAIRAAAPATTRAAAPATDHVRHSQEPSR